MSIIDKIKQRKEEERQYWERHPEEYKEWIESTKIDWKQLGKEALIQIIVSVIATETALYFLLR